VFECIIGIALKWLFLGKLKPHMSFKRGDLFVQLLHSYYAVFQENTCFLMGALFSGSWIRCLLYKLCGMDINVFGGAVIHGRLTDYDCISIGDDSVLNPGSVVCGHTYEHGMMRYNHTAIAKRSTIYTHGIVWAGESMQEASILGTGSKVYGVGEPAESDVMSIGVPAQARELIDASYVEDSGYHMAIRHLNTPSYSVVQHTLSHQDEAIADFDDGTGGEDIPLLNLNKRDARCCGQLNVKRESRANVDEDSRSTVTWYGYLWGCFVHQWEPNRRGA